MIEKIIEHIASFVPAVCDEGWFYDAHHDFCQRKEWSKARAFIRTNPSCLLELKSLVSEDVPSLGDLRKIQQSIWHNMSGSRFEASSIAAYQEASVLRFVTVGKGDLYHLPGRMIVGGTHYHELVRRYENKARSRIPSAPFSIDLSDLDEPLPSNEESELTRTMKDWDDDEIRIREIMTIIRRIEKQTRTNKKDFMASRLVQDATRFNLFGLLREVHGLSICFSRAELSNWYKELRQVMAPTSKPWDAPAHTIWILATKHVPALKAILKSHQRAMRAIARIVSLDGEQ